MAYNTPIPETGPVIMPGATAAYTSNGVNYIPGGPTSTSSNDSAPITGSGFAASPSASSSSSGTSGSATAPSSATEGSDVSALQNYLVQMGYLTPQQVATGPGVYGPQTTAAVAQMEKNMGVAPNPTTSNPNPDSTEAMTSKYQGFFNSVQNTQAPETQAEASSTISQQTQPSTDPVFNAMTTTMAPILNSLNQVLSNNNNPALTATSLQTEYNNLSSQYNIPQMQASLLNYQNIMNGTEDDVRNEVTTAGGTATESQVLAMTSARNNVILKQYNALSTNYQAAVTNVGNMMQYASADQQTQLQQQSMSASVAESVASIEQNMFSMGQTMEQNANANYQKTLTTLGGNYQAFASTISPNMQPYVESVMGLQPGTLSDPTELSLLSNASLKYQQLQIQAQRAAIYGYNAGYPTTDTSTPTTGTGTTSSNIESIFGASNPIGAYAADPNYTSEISSLYSTVSGLGVASSPATLQKYISNNTPNSPVTGQMITSAAQQTGVDPALLTTVLLHESNFGTVGAATTTDNPGNQGNTGTSTQSFPDWSSGVLATAQNLASRAQAAGVSVAAPTTPAPVQPYAGATPASNVSPFAQNNPVNAQQNGNSYTVQAGDGLQSIAAKYGITSQAGVQAIASINGIQNINSIKAGATLTIPMKVTENATGQTGYISPANFDSSKYTQIGGTATPTATQSAYSTLISQIATAQATPVTGSPLNKGRLSRNAQTALKQYIASPVSQNVSAGAAYLARVNAAMQDPGSVDDTSLADSIIKIETGGGQVTEAQINTYFKGQSFADSFAIQGDKLTAKGGVLSPQQRTDLASLANSVFSNYETQYQQLYVQAAKNLQGQGIPLNYMSDMPDWTSMLSNPPTQ